jgi:hypothetical protein
MMIQSASRVDEDGLTLHVSYMEHRRVYKASNGAFPFEGFLLVSFINSFRDGFRAHAVVQEESGIQGNDMDRVVLLTDELTIRLR